MPSCRRNSAGDWTRRSRMHRARFARAPGWNWPRLRRFLHHRVRINRLVRTGCSVPAWPLLRAHARSLLRTRLRRPVGNGNLGSGASAGDRGGQTLGSAFRRQNRGPRTGYHWTPNRLSGGRQRTSRGSRGCTTGSGDNTRGNRGRAVERPLDGRRRLRRNRRSGWTRGWRWDNRLRRGRRLDNSPARGSLNIGNRARQRVDV